MRHAKKVRCTYERVNKPLHGKQINFITKTLLIWIYG